MCIFRPMPPNGNGGVGQQGANNPDMKVAGVQLRFSRVQFLVIDIIIYTYDYLILRGTSEIFNNDL